MKKVITSLLLTIAITANVFSQKPKEITPQADVKKNDIKVVPVLAPGLIVVLTKPKVCVDKIFDQPVAPPQPGVSIEGLTSQSNRLWPNGSVIKVKFLGGSSIVRMKTMRFANEWSTHVNIRFQFISTGNADINVRFNNDGSSWSMIGTDVKNWEALRRLGEAFAGDIATMNFGWFTDATSDEEFSRVVLHEFGHALGFVHEQGHPDASIPWDREAVYRYYSGPPNNWDRGKIDAQVLQKYSRASSQYEFSNFDRTSIMQYAVDNSLTIGDFEIPWNTVLSQTDKDFSRIMYPRASDRTNKLKVTFKTGGDDLRVNSHAKLIIALNSGSTTKLEVSVNRGAAYGGGSTNVGEVNMPVGINLSNIVKCALVFESGKQFEWDSPDNWNIDEVKLEWIEAGRDNVLLSTVRGTPLIRMSHQSDLLLYPR